MNRYFHTWIFILGFVAIWCQRTEAQLGDFDGNGAWDCSDIDSLTEEIAASGNNLLYDLTADGLVNSEDGSAWLAAAGAQNLSSGQPYLPGDMNLDGNVDGSDRMIQNANKFTSGNGWCGGDVNFDGSTDTSDFNIYNANKFTSSGEPIVDLFGDSPIDDAVDFLYDPTSGLMTIEPGDLDIWCFSVYGAEPDEFLLNDEINVSETGPVWVQDFFLGHAKWFSLDGRDVGAGAAIAIYPEGLTTDDFDYVSFGTPDGIMGRGNVTILNGGEVVPEPSLSTMIFPLVLVTLQLRRRRNSR